MNAKIIASLAFTSMFSLSTLLSPAHAEEQEKALNFGIISTESQQNLKPQWTPIPPAPTMPTTVAERTLDSKR